MHRGDSITATLRETIKRCGQSRYEIAKATGIEQAALSRFMHGGSLTLKTADRLAAHFKLVLRKDR